MVVFNVIAFVSPGWIGIEKYTTSFWIGYIAVMAAFVVNLVVATTVLYFGNKKELFYNLSVLHGNHVGLILAFIVGGAFMLIPDIPYWVCILISVILTAGSVLTFVKAKSAATVVSDMDEKIENSTQFMKVLRADTKSLLSVAKDEKIRQLVQKVYEAARYSDPVSNKQLESVEQKIANALETFTEAVNTESEDVEAAANNLLYLINNRNEKCKVLK